MFRLTHLYFHWKTISELSVIRVYRTNSDRNLTNTIKLI